LLGRGSDAAFLAECGSREMARDSLYPGSGARTAPERGAAMLWTIFVVLLVLWLLGLVSGYTLSGFIHILLVLAVVVLIINLVQGRRVV
jgi:hypothetical protein